MPGTLAKAGLALIALVTAATSAQPQTRHRYEHERDRPPKEVERPAPPPSVDKRDSVVTAVGGFNGRPYWLALAQCGGIYFKLNVLYTGIAVQARAVKPDPKINAEYTRKLNEAISDATAFFNGADQFLATDRGLERTDAVLTYDEQSRAAGERVKTVAEALAAAKACPVLYQACQQALPKACGAVLVPTS